MSRMYDGPLFSQHAVDDAFQRGLWAGGAAVEIVRALAATHHEPFEWCWLCRDDEHEPGCPWRLAREWVEENPE